MHRLRWLLPALVLALTLAWPAAAHADAPFGPTGPIATDADAAHSVLAADVDGDGDLDAGARRFHGSRLPVAWIGETGRRVTTINERALVLRWGGNVKTERT